MTTINVWYITCGAGGRIPAGSLLLKESHGEDFLLFNPLLVKSRKSEDNEKLLIKEVQLISKIS